MNIRIRFNCNDVKEKKYAVILTYKEGIQSGLVVNRTKIIKVTCKMRKEIEKKRNEKKT